MRYEVRQADGQRIFDVLLDWEAENTESDVRAALDFLCGRPMSCAVANPTGHRFCATILDDDGEETDESYSFVVVD